MEPKGAEEFYVNADAGAHSAHPAMNSRTGPVFWFIFNWNNSAAVAFPAMLYQ